MSIDNKFTNIKWHTFPTLWLSILSRLHGQKVREGARFSIYCTTVSVCLELCHNGGHNKEVDVHAALSVHILTRCGLKLREAQMVDRVESCDEWKIISEC